MILEVKRVKPSVLHVGFCMDFLMIMKYGFVVIAMDSGGTLDAQKLVMKKIFQIHLYVLTMTNAVVSVCSNH